MIYRISTKNMISRLYNAKKRSFYMKAPFFYLMKSLGFGRGLFLFGFINQNRLGLT